MNCKRKPSVPVFILCLLIPILSGLVIGLLTRNSMTVYESVARPPYAPPSFLFPIVWTLLYALMGVSLYLVYLNCGKALSYVLFASQLFLNLLWPVLFFSVRSFEAAFICLIVLLMLILSMIISFSRSSVAAALLQIPYFLWVSFAGVLNLYITLANF